MPNPTLPALADEAEAKAIAKVLDGGTGISHVQYNAGPEDVPSVFTQYTQATHHLMLLLGKLNQGCVVKLTGLNVGAFALDYQIGATAYAYAGDTTYACTDDAVNYLFLDTDETLKKSTSAWPGTSHIKLAKVVCASGAISSVTDCRWMNLQVGSIENWYDYAAGADVDINDQSLDDVGGLKLNEPVIAEVDGAGAVAYAALFMELKGAGGAADDLEDITYAGADEGRLLILTKDPTSGVVTVKDGVGNIQLLHGDCPLDTTIRLVLMYDHSYGGWIELTRNLISPATLTRDMNVSQEALFNIGRINIYGYTSKTIASGCITYASDSTWYSLLNQSSDPTDDLDTISGGADGDILILQAESDAQVPTVKHGTGNIELANAHDYELSDTKRRLVLQYDGTLAKWVEIARSYWGVLDLQGTGNAIAWQPSWYIPETLVLNTTYSLEVYVHQAVVIKDFAVRVTTAPSGGTCVVDIKVDDVTKGSATIADGEFGAVSATLDEAVSATKIITFATQGINGADGLTVSPNGRVAVLAE